MNMTQSSKFEPLVNYSTVQLQLPMIDSTAQGQ